MLFLIHKTTRSILLLDTYLLLQSAHSLFSVNLRRPSNICKLNQNIGHRKKLVQFHWIRKQNITCKGIIQGAEKSQQAKLLKLTHLSQKERNLKTKCNKYMFQATVKDCPKKECSLFSLQQLFRSAV